ncbi:MAG: DUF2971 domain-containing protein [Alistipes sp.]
MAVKFENYLYHFTTCESLFGMLQGYSVKNPNLTMWATHYAFMNDSSEYEFGKRVCREAMQIYESRNGITADKSFLKCASEREQDAMWTPREPYIISFGADCQDASMWDMYADKGRGIALMIENPTCILSGASDNSPKNRPSKCHYCGKSTDLIDNNCIPSLYNVFEINTNNTDCVTTISPIDAYLAMPPTIKHKAFAHEKEYRMILRNAKDEYAVKYRVRKGVIVPYIEKEIPTSLLQGILVGPRADFEQTKLSLQMFLTSKGGNLKSLCHCIYKSDIPFRG